MFALAAALGALCVGAGAVGWLAQPVILTRVHPAYISHD